MGLFDRLMPGETGGMPDDNSQSNLQGLLNGGNPLLNIGLGILANNHGNYGSFGAAIGKGTQQGIQNNQQYQQLMQQKQLQALKMKQYQYEMDKQTKQDASDQAYGDSFNAAVQQPTNIANQSFQDANNNAMQGSDALPMQGSVGDNLSPVDSSQPYSTSQTSAGGFDKSAFLQAVMSNPNVSADKKMAVMQAMQKDTTPIKVSAGDTFIDPTTFKPVYSQPDKPNYNQAFNTDGSPNLPYQEYEKTKGKDASPFFSAQQTPDGLISFDSRTGNATPVNINGKQVMGGKPVIGTTLGANAIDVAAQNYRNGMGLPALGMSGAADKKAIMNRAGEMDFRDGIKGLDASTNQITGKATIGGINQLQKQKTMVSSFEKNAQLNGNMALDLSDQVDRTGIPLLNSWLQSGQKAGTNNPKLAQFNAANETFVNEYAKIMSGSMGNTPVSDNARAHAHGLLATVQTKEAYRAVMGTLNQEMGNRMKGMDDELAFAKQSFNHSSQAFGAPGTTATDKAEGVKNDNFITLKPIPLPAKVNALTLKKGNVYQTGKGSLRWNGSAFEDM